MVTTLGLLPSAGAQNSGMRTISPEKVHPYRAARCAARVKHRDPKAAANRQRLVFRGFDQKEFLHLGQLLRHLGGEVVGLAPVLLQVVKLPDVLVRRPLPNAGR